MTHQLGGPPKDRASATYRCPSSPSHVTIVSARADGPGGVRWSFGHRAAVASNEGPAQAGVVPSIATFGRQDRCRDSTGVRRLDRVDLARVQQRGLASRRLHPDPDIRSAEAGRRWCLGRVSNWQESLRQWPGDHQLRTYSYRQPSLRLHGRSRALSQGSLRASSDVPLHNRAVGRRNREPGRPTPRVLPGP